MAFSRRRRSLALASALALAVLSSTAAGEARADAGETRLSLGLSTRLSAFSGAGGAGSRSLGYGIELSAGRGLSDWLTVAASAGYGLSPDARVFEPAGTERFFDAHELFAVGSLRLRPTGRVLSRFARTYPVLGLSAGVAGLIETRGQRFSPAGLIGPTERSPTASWRVSAQLAIAHRLSDRMGLQLGVAVTRTGHGESIALFVAPSWFRW